MHIETVRDHCLLKRGVEESFPFDDETLVFKICGKIFAVLALEKPDRVTLKCHPALTEQLRSSHAAVQSAPYFHKATWNQIGFNEDVSDERILLLLDHAYAETLRGLPKKTQVAFFHDGLPPHICHTHLNVCTSTMEVAAQLSPPASPCLQQLITTDLQRIGRGQRGNTWESQNGANLLFSIAFEPLALKPAQQFRLSQVAALSLLEAVRSVRFHMDSSDVSRFTIKWPNDLYYDNDKLAGMLLEHEVQGERITRTILGIGVNVNQTVFHGDAPNPISLAQITGYDTARFILLEQFLTAWVNNLSLIHAAEPLQEKYMQHLYRAQARNLYEDKDGQFHAMIDTVLPDGRLQLRREDGKLQAYAFKEVQYII